MTRLEEEDTRKSHRQNNEVVHWLELLPGARESLPSLVWVVAFVASFLLGGLTVLLIGLLDQELLQNDRILIGGFLLGAGASLFGFLALIRRWVSRRSQAQRGRRRPS